MSPAPRCGATRRPSARARARARPAARAGRRAAYLAHRVPTSSRSARSGRTRSAVPRSDAGATSKDRGRSKARAPWTSRSWPGHRQGDDGPRSLVDQGDERGVVDRPARSSGASVVTEPSGVDRRPSGSRKSHKRRVVAAPDGRANALPVPRGAGTHRRAVRDRARTSLRPLDEPACPCPRAGTAGRVRSRALHYPADQPVALPATRRTAVLQRERTADPRGTTGRRLRRPPRGTRWRPRIATRRRG